MSTDTDVTEVTELTDLTDHSDRGAAGTNATTAAADARGRAQTFTVPGMDVADAAAVVNALQDRLDALIDLTLTLKHVHWNVVGAGFIAVHVMLDEQYTAAAGFVDDTAERIAALGGSPNGLAGALVARRPWEDYPLGRAVVPQHLKALDQAYHGVISSHREAVGQFDELDPVSQDMLIGQLAQLEGFQWFIRAHLENGEGVMAT